MLKEDFSLIKRCIKKASNVFVMGHRDIDLDAFGAALGICCYASFYQKDSYIIVDDKKLETSVSKAIDDYKEKINIIGSNKVKDNYSDNSLLIIVDTNKELLLQTPKLLSLFNNVIVIDHHDVNFESINDDKTVLIIDNEASSTCEMITNMLLNDNYIVSADVATIILSGIVLDTNNFILKTDTQTYYAAYYLAKCGADTSKVQYLMKQDIKQYIEMQKVITEVKVNKNIAISKGLQNKIYRREYLAKIADTILLFNNIEASFVVGKITDGIGISARSMGNIDVGEIMERFGGGGDNHEGAAKVNDKSLNDVVEEITKIAKEL